MRDPVSRIKRQRILDAAMHVFSERGFHHATVSEVARAAHVGKGTVYLYFAGKEDLLVSLFDELADRLVWVFDRILVEGESLDEAIRRLVSEQIDDGQPGAQVFRLMAQQPFLANLTLQREKHALVRRIVERVAVPIRDAIAHGFLRSCDATLCASVLLALPAAIPLYEVAATERLFPSEAPRVATELSGLLWNGLKKEGSP